MPKSPSGFNAAAPLGSSRSASTKAQLAIATCARCGADVTPSRIDEHRRIVHRDDTTRRPVTRARSRAERFTCSICRQSFKGDDIVRHLQTTHKREAAVTRQTNSSQLRATSNPASNAMRVSCDICGVQVNDTRLEKHRRKVHTAIGQTQSADNASPQPRGKKSILAKRSISNKKSAISIPQLNLEMVCGVCGERQTRGYSTRDFGLVCFRCMERAQAKRSKRNSLSRSVWTVSTPAGGQVRWKRR